MNEDANLQVKVLTWQKHPFNAELPLDSRMSRHKESGALVLTPPLPWSKTIGKSQRAKGSVAEL